MSDFGGRKWRARYQFSLRALFLFAIALSVAFGLLREWALADDYWAATVAVALLGAAIGAPVAHAFDDERGGKAFIGAVAGAIFAVLLFCAGIVAVGLITFFTELSKLGDLG